MDDCVRSILFRNVSFWSGIILVVIVLFLIGAWYA